MKYRVIEEICSEGIPFSYSIAVKILFWWMPCSGMYTKKEYAEEACKRLNGSKRYLDE